MVVRQLAAEGTPVLALARSADSDAARELAGLANVEVRQGDVRELASLKSAAAGCENIVACYGMRPPRFPKLSDIWTDPFEDAAHPANINFKGVENIISASKATGVKRVVRLTGLSVGLSPWSPISILFSIVLSFSNMWNRRGEMLLRESGLDYTIVRPGGLKDDPPAKERGDRLLLASESWGDDQPPATTGISRADVASLLCLSLGTVHARARAHTHTERERERRNAWQRKLVRMLQTQTLDPKPQAPIRFIWDGMKTEDAHMCVLFYAS